MAQLPAVYQACCYAQPGQNKVEIREDMPLPELGPGEILVNLTHSGVCHSDYDIMMNAWPALTAHAPTLPGQVGGHEGVGRVVKLGPGTEQMRKIGERVGLKWLASVCGQCTPCLDGRESGCTSPSKKMSGATTPGTFQQYAVAQANYVTPIPDAVESAAAAPMLCAGVTAYGALRRARLFPGQFLAILGAGGGLGHLGVQMAAKGMGYRVIGIDHSSKEQFVLDSGAEAFVAFDAGKDVIAEVLKVTGGLGVHAAIPFTSSNGAYGQALGMLRLAGTLVCVGVPAGEMREIMGASPMLMIFKELCIVGSAVGNRKDAIECLDMAARGIVKVHYRLEKMERLPDIFDEIRSGNLQGRVVLDLASSTT